MNPVGAFCALLGPPNCHIMQNQFFPNNYIIYYIPYKFPIYYDDAAGRIVALQLAAVSGVLGRTSHPAFGMS